MATLAATFDPADKSTPGHYGPSETALLLLDFHSHFLPRLDRPTALAAVEVAAKMRTWAKSQGIQVVHALIDFNDTPYPTCKSPARFAAMVAATAASDRAEPAELLEDSGDDVTFTRRPGYVSALKSPGLVEFLQEKGIKSLILTGISTSGCVMRTAVTATDAEYVVSIVSDGCADPGEGVHDMMVGKVLNMRAFVTTAAEFQEGFAKAASGK